MQSSVPDSLVLLAAVATAIFMHASLCQVATTQPSAATCPEHPSYALAAHGQAAHVRSPNLSTSPCS